MKVAIVGYDTEGKSSFEYFAQQGHELTIHDQNTEVTTPDGVASVLGDAYLDNLDQYDVIVRTAGLPPSKILAKNPGVTEKITTQINEFLKVSPTKNIIGITGTKGKGTTSTLITKMLEASGKAVQLGGNIGIPPFSFLDQLTGESWVVLELSSFQLIDVQSSPHIGVCLMVVPEHLNWHEHMDEYTGAKAHLFSYQQPGDIAIYFANNDVSKKIAAAGEGHKLPYFTPPGAHVADSKIVMNDQVICAVDEIKLLGAHNWQNVCAAVTAVWQATPDAEAIRSVLTTFTGLPHRLELVRELDGVRYYDDSFGTTPETAIVALQAFSDPKIAILGGSDKGADYGELARVVAGDSVRKVLLIGEQAGRIQAALEQAGFHDYMPGGANMSEIIATAREQAQPGDVVLLSAGCASFDMFKNYKDRGEQFTAAVQALA